MAILYGMRKVKVFPNVPAGTNTQVDGELFGTMRYGYFKVLNVNANPALKLTVNANPTSSVPGVDIPIPGASEEIPLYISNFTANDVVTVIAYGN